MKTNYTFFSFSRFAHLCYMDYVQHWKKRLMTFLVIYGVLAFTFFFTATSTYSKLVWTTQNPDSLSMDVGMALCAPWLLAILVLVVVYPATFMYGMKSHTGRISALMVPATTFEKFFLRWLVCTVHFTIAALLAFFLADLTRVGICRILYPGFDFIAPLVVSIPSIPDEVLKELVSLFVWLTLSHCVLVQSFYALGSVIWRRNPALKTTLALFVLSTVTSLLFSDYMPHLLLTRSWESAEIVEAFRNGIRGLTIFSFLFAAVNWVISYFRFKELEIIDRW